jgi:hypothetical protein
MIQQFIYFLFFNKKNYTNEAKLVAHQNSMVISSMGTSHVCNEIGAIGLLRIIPFKECNELFNFIFYI